MDLLKRRGEIIADHKSAEKVPQSPLSPKHPDMRAAMDAGAALYSERPVAFLQDDEVVVVGDCVGKVYAGFKKFIDHVDKNKLYDARMNEPVVTQSIAKIRQALASPPPKEIRVGQQRFNAYLFGLGEVGVHVVLTDGTYEPTA